MPDHIGKEGYGERKDEQMEAVGETACGGDGRHVFACRGTAGRLFGRDFYAEDGEGIPRCEGCGFPVGAAGFRDGCDGGGGCGSGIPRTRHCADGAGEV